MNFWSSEIEPGINVSAWLAIDDTDVTNSCVQLMPGSHRKMIPHIKATPEQAFRQQGDPDHIGVDPDRVVKMKLKAGQFFLFTERMLHYSSANTSDRHAWDWPYALPFRLCGVTKGITFIWCAVKIGWGLMCMEMRLNDRDEKRTKKGGLHVE